MNNSHILYIGLKRKCCSLCSTLAHDSLLNFLIESSCEISDVCTLKFFQVAISFALFVNFCNFPPISPT